MPTRNHAINDGKLRLILVNRKPFKIKIHSQGHTYVPIYTRNILYGELFLFKLSKSKVSIARAIELTTNDAYKALLIPKKCHLDKNLTVKVKYKNVLCKLERL